jgi:hypothetical protein
VTATGLNVANAQCPAGKFVISGGGVTDTGFLFASLAQPPQGWAAADDTAGATVTAQAFCGAIAAGAAPAAVPQSGSELKADR